MEIVPSDGLLKECVPNLMPFHLSYSGPASISRYFRVRPAPPNSLSSNQTANSSSIVSSSLLEGSSASSLSTLVASTTSSSLSDDVSVGLTGDETEKSPVATSIILDDSVQNDKESQDTAIVDLEPQLKRFVSSFRGRLMQGLKVDLPESYGGIIFQSPGIGEETAPEILSLRQKNSQAKQVSGRAARRPRRSVYGDQGKIDMDECNETGDADERWTNDSEVRLLKPISTFSSFLLWSPDIPVDEGKDEYLRCLTEWTKLSAEIHHYEE